MQRRPLAIAICAAVYAAALASASVALAACAFDLPALGDGNTVELQLTPAGKFLPSDGRAMSVPAWNIDAKIANRVIAAFNARKNPAVLDYEHQTLLKDTNGQPAPAAGWIRSLQWRDGSGLWATVELTVRAKQYIADGEYKFISPVFAYDDKTGDVTAVLMAALTNFPAIDGMAEVQLRAAATFGLTQTETSMDKLLLAIIAALGLNTGATADEAVAACAGIKPKFDELAKLRAELGIAENADAATAIATCTALKTKATASATVDPAKYVPVDVVNELKTQIAALSANYVASKVSELVDAGLKDGRILPAMKDWAKELGKKDIAALTAYLEKASPIAALAGTQTNGKAPEADNPHKLSSEELAVCTRMGIKPEDFVKTKTKGA